MISEHVSLAAAALQQVDESSRGRIAKAVMAKVSTYEEEGKVRIPGVARCIVGTNLGRPNWSVCACRHRRSRRIARRQAPGQLVSG